MKPAPLLLVVVGAAILFLDCSPSPTQTADGQVRGTPDQSVEQARTIPPFPPTEVLVKHEGTQAVVTWKPIPLDNIVGYKVYRKIGDSEFKHIGTVKHPPFVDDKVPTASTS